MCLSQYKTEDLFGPLNEVERKNAPETLYLCGDEKLLIERSKVSIVGSRKASHDGLKRASSLARELVKYNVIVVSGLAAGIDTAAHRTAIDSGGSTVAVLGTPVTECYPRNNLRLYNEIKENHLLVSQFPEGYSGGKKNFPMRNRTMALLSDATVIIEAQDKSGTLHQGWEAIRLGRPLFILQSNIDDSSLSWPKELLDYGAQPLSRENLPLLFEQISGVGRKSLEQLAF